MRRTLEEMSQSYSRHEYLSYNIRYRYTPELEPSNYLDSVSGSYRAHNGLIWYRLDSTEAVMNKDLTIMVFRDDSLLYLAAPVKGDKPLVPMLMIDSIYSTYKGLTGTVVKTGSGYEYLPALWTAS
ncbi:MAG: hypothetical protein EOP09_18990 [Proteobacteria bacterium]|nr:MAG: hypothetical protein EOP09_18990 [Pseudomonadota bacterium]